MRWAARHQVFWNKKLFYSRCQKYIKQCISSDAMPSALQQQHNNAMQIKGIKSADPRTCTKTHITGTAKAELPHSYSIIIKKVLSCYISKNQRLHQKAVIIFLAFRSVMLFCMRLDPIHHIANGRDWGFVMRSKGMQFKCMYIYCNKYVNSIIFRHLKWLRNYFVPQKKKTKKEKRRLKWAHTQSYRIIMFALKQSDLFSLFVSLPSMKFCQR